MQVLGVFSRFEQSILSMALINLCDNESYVCQQMQRENNYSFKSTYSTEDNIGFKVNQCTIYLPHPDQKYEDVTLEEGLTKGYNIEVQPVKDSSELMYNIPKGGHFVVVMKQNKVDTDFVIAATGIFVRSLGIITLDLIIDPDEGEYQSLIIKHPIIRNYPQDWETKLKMFLKQQIRWEELPQLVRYVDRSVNQDYRPPSWHECYLPSKGIIGF